MSGRPLHEVWHYDGADPGLMLFTAALQAWQLPILPGQRILELGCNESDFLPRLKRAMLSLQLTGVDWRPSDAHARGASLGHDEGWTFVQGCAWDTSLFPPASFDWVIMLGALEHFGLGWHEYGDPVDRLGDAKTMHAVTHWLAPGGQVYFDVPCNPERSQTAHFRTYRAMHHFETPGLREVARGFSLPEPHAGTWVPQPTVHRHPYHYVALWQQRREV